MRDLCKFCPSGGIINLFSDPSPDSNPNSMKPMIKEILTERNEMENNRVEPVFTQPPLTP